MPDETRLTRQELYRLVWSESMLSLAKKFNLSDVGLAKICKKHHVPRPGPGHWAKVQAGKEVKQTPLPDIHTNPVITIDTSGQHREMMERHAYSAEKLKAIISAFSVPEKLTNPHPLIVKTQQAFKDDKDAYYKNHDILDIHVSHNHYSRALRIMDTFIKIMERRGHIVKIESRCRYDTSPRTSVVVQGNDIHIKIFENQSRLTFGFDGYMEGRRNWSDGKTQRIEEKLYEITLKILLVARKRLHQHIKWRIEARKREALERIQAEKERLQREEEERIRHLEMEAENWHKSRFIREYLNAVVDYVKNKHGGYDEESQFGLWLQWAHCHADKLDPLSE